MITITAQLEAKDLTGADSATLEVIRRIRDESVSSGELDRAITAAEAERVFGRELVNRRWATTLALAGGLRGWHSSQPNRRAQRSLDITWTMG